MFFAATVADVVVIGVAGVVGVAGDAVAVVDIIDFVLVVVRGLAAADDVFTEFVPAVSITVVFPSFRNDAPPLFSASATEFILETSVAAVVAVASLVDRASSAELPGPSRAFDARHAALNRAAAAATFDVPRNSEAAVIGRGDR